ncbi:MAG: sigma-70 family RNA polymerase sigma factor [Planctomycetota bacterium]
MTDQQALERYANHADVEAFQYLVNTYQRMVYAACRRQLQREADVEDAVQETFLRLATHAGTIRKNLGAWLHTCATHVSITRIRRDATRRRHEMAWTPVDDPAAAEASRAIMAEVDAAMERLSDDDRELILAYYLEGRTQKSLAEDHGVSQPGLKHRLDRATERLRKKLRQRGVTATATGVAAFLAADAAQAQVPATLTAGLTKLGLGAVGTSAGLATTTTAGGGLLATLATGKLVWAGVATLAVAAGGVGVGVGVTKLTGGSNTPPIPVSAAAPAALNESADLRGMSPDDRFFQKYHSLALEIDGVPNLVASVEGRDFSLTLPTHSVDMRVVGGDPDANPPTLDLKIVRAQGEVDEQLESQVGQVLRAIYRIEGNGDRFIIVHNAPGERRPRRFPGSVMEAMQDGLELAVLVREGPRPAVEAIPEIDADLQGNWTRAEFMLHRFTPETIFFYDIFDPDGEPAGELRVREWKTDVTPHRVGGIWRRVPDPSMLGRVDRRIYREAGDKIEFAFFLHGSPFSGQYPTGFNDRRPGLVLQTAIPYVP